MRTAGSAVRRGKAYDIETDRFGGRRVWEVKVAPGSARPHELDVRADGRKVLRQRRVSRDDDSRQAARARVGLAGAMRIAARRAGGAVFDEAEIDRFRGRVAWEVSFKRSRDRELEVRVDARSGKVLDVGGDD